MEPGEKYALILSTSFCFLFFGFNTAQNFVVPLLGNFDLICKLVIILFDTQLIENRF